MTNADAIDWGAAPIAAVPAFPAAGFAPCRTAFAEDWVRSISSEIVAYYRTRDGVLSWVRRGETPEGMRTEARVDVITNVRTPERLGEVVRCLLGLYGPEASARIGEDDDAA